MKDFDELLDGVLREDASAQPRAGLEARVMARVQLDGGHGAVLGLRHRWRRWLLVPGTACLGIVVAVWYVSSGNLPQPDRVASRVSAPVLSVHLPAIVGSLDVAERRQSLAESDSALSREGRTSRHMRLVRDKAAPKVRHALSEDSPKLESFPAVSQKGDIANWMGGDDGGKLAAVAREASPEILAAYQQLRSTQGEPIDIAAIEIKPLQ